MSIASEITRLQTSKADSKAQINIDKDIINDGIDFINNEKVDSYDEKIAEMQEAYKAFIPVNTTSDTQIDAPKGGTIIGKTIKGNTTQDGTPTPDAPVEVKNVTGLQTVTISNGTDSKDYEINLGKNLLPNNATTTTINGITFTINEDKSILVNGTATSNIMFYLLLSSENKIIDTGNYYLSGCPSGGTIETYRLVIGVNETLYGEYGSGRALTLNKGILKSYIYITSGTTINNKIFKPQLEKGNTPTSYAPYFTPIELNKIGDYQDFIRKGTGKNLFNKDTITTGKYITDTGGEGTNNTTFYSDYIKVQPNTKYYVSGRNNGWGNEAFYDENKIFISRPNEANNIFTTTSTTYYIRVNGHLNDVNNLQMEQGTTATYYEPYGYKDQWYIEKNVLKLVVPDAVTGTMQNSNKRFYVNGIEFGTINILKNTQSSKTYGLYCDILGEVTAGQTWGGTQGISYDYNSSVGLGCMDFAINGLTTVADYQNALKGKAIYAIANTPEYTLIENEELLNQLDRIMQLYEGQNNISVDGSIPVYMDLDYIVRADRYLIGNRREGK